MTRGRERIPAVLTALAVAAAAGCSRPRDPARQLLDELVEAAEHRNAEGFVARLAPSFQGQGGLDRKATAAELRRYFGLYAGLDVTLSDVTVEPEAPGARLEFRADFEGRPKDLPGVEGLLPRASAFRFTVRAAPGRAGEPWMATSAEWERLGIPGEP